MKSGEGLLVLAIFLLSACGANQEILNSGKTTPTAANTESPKSTLDDEINNMRTADFRFIWVLRRKDGGVLDTADKTIIRANTVEINRRVLADDDKALVLGSNTTPFRENFDALNRAFAIQNLSPEPVPSPLPTRQPTPKDPKIIR